MEELAALRRRAGAEAYAAGQMLYREGSVRFLAEEGSSLCYAVGRSTPLAVQLIAEDPPRALCPCPEGKPCRHIVAAFSEAYALGRMTLAKRHRAEENTRRLREALRQALPPENTPRLEVTVRLPAAREDELSLSLRVGEERLYQVRSVPSFLSALEKGEPIPFSRRWSLYPQRAPFSPEDQRLLALLSDICEVLSLCGRLAKAGREARMLPIPKRYETRLLSLLESRSFLLAVGKETFPQSGIAGGRVQLRFSMTLHGREIEVNASAPPEMRPVSREAGVVFCGGELLRLPDSQRPFVFSMDAPACAFFFPPQDAVWAVSDLLPRLMEAGETAVLGHLKDRLVRRPLLSEAQLDRAERSVTCRLLFRYGDVALDPFGSPSLPEGLLLLRDAEGETRVIRLLRAYGFTLPGGEAILSGSERIFRFFTEGLPRLQEVSQVFLSDAFRRMRPRRAAFSARVRGRGGMLLLELLSDGEPMEETEGILAALRSRRHWYRLEDGGFLDLSELAEDSGWQALADTALPDRADETRRGPVEVMDFRAFCLSRLLAESRVPAEADEAAKKAFEPDTDPCPEPLGSRLRPYQATGFAWLQTLARLSLSGILADDMGLGKTVQLLSLLLWAKKTENRGKPSILVAPTSLLYNWAEEAGKFTPELSLMIAEGGQEARVKQADSLSRAGAPDLYLTSYPLLRRDIDFLSGTSFRFAVLDEAQYVKNAAGASAAAVRRLSAETRLALTGTPMENHPGEIWSLFDFLLPGYLGSYSSFMRRCGAGEDDGELRRRIRPFLLRRLKKDVLRELPEKTENVIRVEMTPEQARVYRAALARLRPGEADLSGAGRFRALAALTELREVCDHPGLILSEYQGSSGKLELLSEFLPSALASGHRVLVFSQFTRMLRILEQRLYASGIECFYLDGETPARERLQMAKRFNQGEGNLFLISLKAGGAGLNLTGADFVIHYDPWWNPAAEDQATDRAHRIGQGRPVTVTRLITRNTVEERVYALSQKKRDLFARMIEAGETFPTALSEEEIRSLFSEPEEGR